MTSQANRQQLFQALIYVIAVVLQTALVSINLYPPLTGDGEGRGRGAKTMAVHGGTPRYAPSAWTL